jgi:hypothetical protein
MDTIDLSTISAADFLQGLEDGTIVMPEAEKTAGGVESLTDEQLRALEAELGEEEKVADVDVSTLTDEQLLELEQELTQGEVEKVAADEIEAWRQAGRDAARGVLEKTAAEKHEVYGRTGEHVGEGAKIGALVGLPFGTILGMAAGGGPGAVVATAAIGALAGAMHGGLAGVGYDMGTKSGYEEQKSTGKARAVTGANVAASALLHLPGGVSNMAGREAGAAAARKEKTAAAKPVDAESSLMRLFTGARAREATEALEKGTKDVVTDVAEQKQSRLAKHLPTVKKLTGAKWQEAAPAYKKTVTVALDAGDKAQLRLDRARGRIETGAAYTGSAAGVGGAALAARAVLNKKKGQQE